LTLAGPEASANGAAASSGQDSAIAKAKTNLKGGLTLVYDPDGEKEGEISMEETRALLPRYQKMLLRALNSSSTISATA
jgi:hypothetical protein